MHLSDARDLVLSQCHALEPETVPLDAALGRVLAERVCARTDVPGESRSRFDGYAVLSRDLVQARSERLCILKVLPGLLPAGHATARSIGPGECVRIMTGAPLPEGADAVLPQESVALQSGRLLVHRPCAPGDGVVAPGADARAGETVLESGEVLTPTRMALAAALGMDRLAVTRRPKVAVLSTGDEVRELGGTLGGALTHCNTRYLLAWSVLEQGGEPIHLGTVEDDPDALADRLEAVDADLVISTGGMGRGDRDFVLKAWERIGIRPLFCEVNLSPGRRSAFGILADRLFWGVPGNPWGAQVVFAELIAPSLLAMLGATARGPFSTTARLGAPLRNKTDGFKAVRGMLELRDGAVVFSPSGGGVPRFPGLRREMAYALLEAGRSDWSVGDVVSVRLHDFPLLASPLLSVVS